MKTPRIHGVSLLAMLGTCLATSFGQVQTYETQTGYLGSVSTFGASGSSQTRGQVFTDVSSVASLTYNFFVGSATTSTETTLTATFGRWNSGTNSFYAGTTVSFGTITVPPSDGAGWTNALVDYDGVNHGSYLNYSQTFDFAALASPLVDSTYGYLTDPNYEYALMLTNTTGVVTNLGLGLSNDDIFSHGYAKGSSDYDYVFSTISITPGDVSIPSIPESSTVAAMIAVAFVAGLAGFRLRQRRQLVPASVSAA